MVIEQAHIAMASCVLCALYVESVLTDYSIDTQTHSTLLGSEYTVRSGIVIILAVYKWLPGAAPYSIATSTARKGRSCDSVLSRSSGYSANSIEGYSIRPEEQELIYMHYA